MISWLLSLLGGVKSAVLGVVGVVAGLWALWAKRKINRQAERIDHQDRVISTYKVKDEIYRQDQRIETEANNHIAEIRKKVDYAESPEQAAQAVADGLNEIFGGKK